MTYLVNTSLLWRFIWRFILILIINEMKWRITYDYVFHIHIGINWFRYISINHEWFWINYNTIHVCMCILNCIELSTYVIVKIMTCICYWTHHQTISDKINSKQLVNTKMTYKNDFAVKWEKVIDWYDFVKFERRTLVKLGTEGRPIYVICCGR